MAVLQLLRPPSSLSLLFLRSGVGRYPLWLLLLGRYWLKGTAVRGSLTDVRRANMSSLRTSGIFRWGAPSDSESLPRPNETNRDEQKCSLAPEDTFFIKMVFFNPYGRNRLYYMLYMHCVSLETTQRCLSKSILHEKNITTFFALVMVWCCTSWYDMTETLIKSSEIKQNGRNNATCSYWFPLP